MWWQIKGYQNVRNDQKLMSRKAWRMSLSCRSGNGQLSVSECLWHIVFPSEHSLHLSPTLSLLIAPSPSSFLLLCRYLTPSTWFIYFLQNLSPLQTPISVSLSNLIHPFFVNIKECSMWQAVALWLFILVNLLRGEWLSSVPWVRLRLDKCLFSACDVCTVCACACLCH